MIKTGLKFSLFFLIIACLSLCCPLSDLSIFENSPEEQSGSPFLTQSAAELMQEKTSVLPAVTNETIQQTPASQNTETPQITETQPPDSTLYEISNTLILKNEGPGEATKVSLWVAAVHSLSPYQEVLESSFDPPYDDLEKDDYGNEYAVYNIYNIPVGTELEFKLSYTVKVNSLDFDLGDCQGDLPDYYTLPEEFIESDDPLITQLALDLSQEKTTSCEIVRSYYDYIAGSFIYKGYQLDSQGALWALENMGGDCTEFSDSLIALSRASEIPARFLEGLTCCTENGYAPDQNKHDWLEIYLPGSGWVPMDPTWGRSSYDRETYFAGITPDHIIVTQGRNPETLSGYHYYSYRYWWGETSANVSSEESWSILKSTH